MFYNLKMKQTIIILLLLTGPLCAQTIIKTTYSYALIIAHAHAGYEQNVTLAARNENDGGIRAIASVRQIGQLTGQPSMNNTGQVNVYGTDLGSMLLHSDGRIYFLFGDTFGPPGTPGSGDWRSNTMAYTTDMVASDGITFDGWICDLSGQAKAVVEGNHDPNDGSGEVTKIPSAGWSFGERQFLWFMSVKQWGTPGQWEVNYSEIAYSDDDGESWFLSGTQWSGSSNFIQVASAEQSGYLLFWGIPAGRFGGVKLARVLPADVLDRAAYQYYMGTGWSTDEADAIFIVDPPVGELSVLWNPYLQRWIMMYLNESTVSIEVREAHEPIGPWSAPWQVASANDYPALYGAFMHDNYIANSGEIVYFLMSQFGPYNVFLMEVTFLRNETGVVEETLSEGIPSAHALHQNCPNPFNATTTIRYSLPKSSHVEIRVYNVQGQMVETLVNGQKSAGYHIVDWDATKLSSGIYLYQIIAGDYKEIRKCVFLK